MKKKLFFLITIICAFFMSQSITVKAGNINIYEGEYIDNIFINKKPSNSGGTIYYQKARFFRETNTNQFLYCIEPNAFFEQSAEYKQVLKPSYLTSQQQSRISYISYFGYKYKNHDDPKWYAIAQLMIWQTVDPAGDYYFTNGLNGNRISPFNSEINEINNLINNIKKAPSIPNEVTVVEGENIILEDKNNSLKYFTSNKGTIEGNKINFGKLPVGKYQYTLSKKYTHYPNNIAYYQANNSQDMVKTGNITPSAITKYINVVNTKIKINKVDAETKDFSPRGKATIEGTVYKIYDKNNNEISTITIDKNGYGEVKNLPFGKYSIKEDKPGLGYLIDEQTYEIELNTNNLEIELNLENNIIKKKIVVQKVYGIENNFQPEKDIIFNIYDSDNKLYDSIKTDEYGYAEILLPFGEYTIKQLNSHEGYEKVKPISIIVNNNIEKTFKLKDYKIKVPDTNTNIIIEILKEIIKLLCLKI